jgi:hypothetical protein
MDVMGGGSSSEALLGIAIGIIEAGMAKTAVIFRSMNGFTGVRMGATGRESPSLSGGALFGPLYGQMSPAQSFSFKFMRHMYDFGTPPEQVAMVKVFHSRHGANNPRPTTSSPRPLRTY